MAEAYGFAYKAPLRERLHMAWLLVKGESVAYHIGCHGSYIYAERLGAIVGCEVRPDGFGGDGAGIGVKLEKEIAGQTEMGGMNG